jgi:quinoprotein glucose dehydrogenase
MPALPKTVDAEQRAALVDYLLLRDRPYREAEPGPLRYTHNGYPKLQDHEGLPGGKPPWGTLNCIDLNTGKLAWKTPLGNYPAMLAQGKLGLGAENFGGASVNAGGVVFCSGTADLQFRAFDANTGAELWQHALPFGGYAPPTLYTANGKAHVLIPATGGGKLNTTPGDAFVAFTL